MNKEFKDLSVEQAALFAWHHVKRGTQYRIVSEAELQFSVNGNAIENTRLVIYRAIKGGKVWARPWAEFFDGRFQPIGEDEVYLEQN